MSTTPASKPVGSRRFWVTVVCFAVANLAIWIGYDHLQQLRRHALLEVRQSEPGSGWEVGGRPNFWWTFNLDVAPGKPTDPPPGTISPAVAGKWTWDGPRTLNFTPDAPLPKATEFTVTLLPERLATPEGFRLKTPHVTSVRTQSLQVLGVTQAAFDERDRLVVEIQFNDDVLPSDAIAHLSLRDVNGKPVLFHPHGDAIGRVIRVLTDPIARPPAEEHHPHLLVQVSLGLAGRSGPLGLTQDFQGSLPIEAALAATGARVYSRGDGPPVLCVRFNNPIDRDAIAPLLSVDPKIDFSVTRGNEENSLELHGDFAPATRYAIKIAPAKRARTDRNSPRPDTLSVFVPDHVPSLRFEHPEGYLGSAGNRTVLAHATNITHIRATVTRMYDNNLVVWRNTGAGTGLLDHPIATKDIKLPALKNKKQDVRLSLDDLLPADARRDGVYMLKLEVPPVSQTISENDGRYWPVWQDSALVTLSDIGLTAKRGRTAVTIWATSLRTSRPLPGVRVRLYSNKNQRLGESKTDSEGLAAIPISPLPDGETPSVILADRTEKSSDDAASETPAATARDLTWLDLGTSKVGFGESDTAGDAYLRNGHEAFVYTDRGVYRPGETVHFRAIVRGPYGATPPSFPVSWRFRRPDLHDWKSVTGRLDSDGAVSLDLPLPDDLPTGRWSVAVGLPGTHKEFDAFGSSSFQVEDFMPNRMQVGLTLKGNKSSGSDDAQRFLMSEEPLSAVVQADYLFGRPVSERPARIVARIDPTTFAPSGWRDWTFGDSASASVVLDNLKVTGHRIELPEQALDAKGHAAFDVDLESLLSGDETSPQPAPKHRRKRHDAVVGVVQPAQPGGARYVGPWRLVVSASVIEQGGRAVTATRGAELDAIPAYIGLRAKSGTVAAGSNSFDVALVAPNGQPIAEEADLEATVYRETWNNSLAYENGHYVYHSTRLLEPVQKKVAVKISAGKGTLDVMPDGYGSYVLCVREGRTGAMTSLAFYSGQGAWEDNISRENPEKLELIARPLPHITQLVRSIWDFDGSAAISAAKDLFHGQQVADGKLRAGDVAQVIVMSPFAGRLLLSVETDDVVTTRVIDMPASQMSVPIEIARACQPNAYITATVIRAVDPDAAWQTHRAIGTMRVRLDNESRKLAVQMVAPQSIRPSTSMGVDVRVTDSLGNPVTNSAVTIAAVDEGICQLTGYATPDPFAYFNRVRALGVETADIFGQLMPEVPKAARVSTVGGDKDAYDPRQLSPVSAKRVKPVALVSPVLHTDSAGMAHADFSVPQFTGKLRLMAVASQGPRFGSGETASLVRSPILVQSSWPRFAAPGDKFMVPMTVFNNTPRPVAARLALRVVDGPLELKAGSTSAINLPSSGQATQWIEVSAKKDSGVCHVSLAASAGDESYDESVEIPVRPASPEIQIGGYAVATPEKPAEVVVPGGMLRGSQRFGLKLTPWPSLELPRGLDYLDRYPYGCLEQTTSTLFPLVYLSDIGQQIAPGLFEKNRIDDKVQAGITRLIGMQTSGGGLSMWPGYREPWPWGTVYAAHFLIEAHNAGHAVPEEFKNSVLTYVRSLLNASSDDAEMLQTQAYACQVLALAGKPERAVMNRLSEVVNATRPDGVVLPGEARLHLAAAWLAAGRRDLAEGLTQQALPEPREKRTLSGALSSPVRDRAILIDTLLAVQPENPALPALVQRLADSGRAGQWRSTQDTAFAVLALGRYLRQNRTVSPYETAALRVGGAVVCEAASGKPLTWDAGPGTNTVQADSTKLTLEITGKSDAKAHVSWLLSGVPLAPQPAADHGMRIRRRLLDERGKPLTSPRVHSGDLVQVELSITSPTALEYIAIDDLLPAGLEIENPRLLTTAAEVAETPKTKGAGNVFVDSRVDMRDDRLVVIGQLTSPGTGTYTYTARAVTPGKFALPPAHAECMYDSGTNSLSEGGTFEVLPAGAPSIANVQE